MEVRRHPANPQPALRRFLLPPSDEHWREPGLIVSYKVKGPTSRKEREKSAPAKSLSIATFETKDLRARRFGLTRRSRPVGKRRPKKTFWSDSSYVL
jgi:hypothetical protein